jgi:hypothetical protein
MAVLKSSHDTAAHGGGSIDRMLALGWRLVAEAEAFALALDSLAPGVPDLPPIFGSPADQASLRSVPPLYLAAELEAAQLLPAAEALAGLFVTGGLHADVGPAARQLVNFWKDRRQRFVASERQAFFAQLFGASSGPLPANGHGRNAEFESLMIDFCESLYKADQDPGFGTGFTNETPVRETGAGLASNLLPRAGGMVIVASRDLLETVGKAVALFKQVPLQQALGAHSLWGAVRNVAQSYLGVGADVDTHVIRGKAGMQVLAWLAEKLPALGESGGRLLSPGDPVMGAAGSWLETSLTLHEQTAGTGASGR